jgi:hypothetical protein
MALTTYCDYDEVRAALGVGEIELPNTVLSLPVYEIGLVRELNRVSVSLPVAFSTCSNKAEESRSDNEQALVDAVRLFSVYTLAKQVGVSLGSIVPKDIGDGKATLSRFSDSPYKEVMKNVEAMYAAVRVSLVDSLALYSGVGDKTASTVPSPVFGKSARGYDPISGV